MMSIHAKQGKKSVDCSVLQKGIFVSSYSNILHVHNMVSNQLLLRYPNISAILKAVNRRDKGGRQSNKQDGYDEEGGIGKTKKSNI